MGNRAVDQLWNRFPVIDVQGATVSQGHAEGSVRTCRMVPAQPIDHGKGLYSQKRPDLIPQDSGAQDVALSHDHGFWIAGGARGQKQAGGVIRPDATIDVLECLRGSDYQAIVENQVDQIVVYLV